MKIKQVSNKQQGVHLKGKFGKVFLPSFVMLVVGPPGSGKTTFLVNILKNKLYYGQCFDKIIYLTPSQLPQVHLSNKNHRSQLDLDFIQQTVYNMNDYYGKTPSNLLIVIDDLMAQFPSKQKQLMPLINNRRHKIQHGTISFIIITQKFNAIPNWVRVAINILVVFKVTTKQSQTMVKQLSLPIQGKYFKGVVGRLSGKDFIIINIQRGKVFDVDFEVID